MTTARTVLSELRRHKNPANIAGMAHYGINPKGTLGVPMPFLRAQAKRLGRDHALARGLWASGIHEARILAALVDDPARVTQTQMERWVREFDSWDVCDGVCANLFDKTLFAYTKAHAWSYRPEEYVKRAAFALIAALAVHDKTAPNHAFRAFLPLVRREASDGRNFVKKAVNWALRQIGKRNAALHRSALAVARRLAASTNPSARWVGKDAVRELAGRGS